MKNKTIIILSGGLDSTTVLYYFLHKGHEIKAISFNYGQRHKIELEKAIATCKKLKISHEIVDIRTITKLISNSSLTSNIKVPEGHYEDETMKQTVVPSRNTIMASIAQGYAYNIGFDNIALGIHAGDHAIYPDCRAEFLGALREVFKINNYKPINVLAPFLHYSKAQIVKIGLKLGVDYSLTHTCYNGKEIACGKCGSCQERLEAFAKNKTKDFIKYKE